MADILIDQQAAPANPAAGKSVVWVDNGTGALIATNSAGKHLGSLSRNESVASQAPGTADTYITNSGLQIPSFGMKVGQQFKWIISLSKTAAGTAAVILQARIGAAQTTADTSRLSLTQTIAQAATATAAMLVVTVGVEAVSATGTIAGGFGFTHTNFGDGKEGQSATFDNSALGGQFLGLSITTGLAAVWTIRHVSAELIG